MAYIINPDKCVMCDSCRTACPQNAIKAHDTEKTYVINPNLCNDCRNMSAVRCVPQCPSEAIAKA